MKLLRHLDEIDSSIQHGAATIGNFDGVHLGHARIMKRVVQQADGLPGPSVVFTFEPHPVRILRPQEAPLPLTWTERKAELLSELGVDVMIACPTDRSLLSLEPAAFFDQIVVERLRTHALVEGPNFHFGKDRAGDTHALKQCCDQHDITLEIVPPYKHGDGFVSSSRVRRCIAEGNVDAARQMLTHPYRIRGMVTHGVARGAQIGFPTANVDAIDTLLPELGVYAGIGIYEDRQFPAAINVGPNPSFGEHRTKIEVHLIDFDESIYGMPLEVDFLSRLRDIRTFTSLAELQAQLHRDVQTARDTFQKTVQKLHRLNE